MSQSQGKLRCESQRVILLVVEAEPGMRVRPREILTPAENLNECPIGKSSVIKRVWLPLRPAMASLS